MNIRVLELLGGRLGEEGKTGGAEGTADVPGEPLAAGADAAGLEGEAGGAAGLD